MSLFEDLEPYKLAGVTVTDRELGHGSYATVLELEYMRLKCAGKKIHEIFLKQQHANQIYTIHRFQNECRILSTIHHPNIVQFLGVYFQSDVAVPILVMEFLPTNLTDCIKNYHGTILQDISYTILHDVALGLCYLHNLDPVIIHRDLSSNNVLLNSNMTAKISDLGVARILDISPLEMTQTPGTPAFMPPEVMVAKPNYNASVDCFSYGIMMIHIFSGKWPEPQIGPNRHQDNQLVPVSEAERRDTFLQIIGNTHPLMDLILKCIQNNPQSRADANEIEIHLARLSRELENRMEILKSIEKERHALSEKEKQLQQSVELLHKENTLLLEKMEKDAQVLKDQRVNFDGLLEPIKAENDELRSKLISLQKELVDTEAALKLKINDYELLLNNLNSQSLPTFAEHITLIREVPSHKQVIITWKKYKHLPKSRSLGQSIVIDGKVYFGGGLTDGTQAKYVVHCYDPSEDEWTDLPPLPVHSFGLGQVNGKLVAVGGKREDKQRTSDVYIYDPRSEEWVKKTSMQTSRASSTVIGLKDALVVVGGYSKEYINIVEILNPHTLRKQKSEPLPTATSNMSAFPIDENECYILGGYKPHKCENRVFHAKLDNLLRKAVSTENVSKTPTDTQPAWKPLPNTPTYQPAAAMLVGSLFAIGGWETAEGKIASTKVHAYSPSTNSWVYVGDLPAPRAVTTAAVLSPTELLVIGGYDNSNRVNVVFKGTLTIGM